MAAENVFLDWTQCPLTQTVHWLTDRYRQSQWLDLSNVLLVMNSSHAQGRLQELLVEHCDQLGMIYTPPTFMTVGQLPEQLYQPQRPFASSIAQRLMWVRALQKMSDQQLQAVIPNPPGKEEIARWLTIVQSLGDLHHDLASEMKRFFSGRDAAAVLNDAQETGRWEFLVEAQRLYWEELNQADLWDRQTARMIAVDHQECHTDRDIVMVGAVDLNQVVRAMLMQVQQRVTVVTFGPVDQPELFDALGCLAIDAWCNKHVDVPEENIQVADRPEDQAGAVIQYLESLQGQYRADEITIGVPDDSIVPYLESEFGAWQIRCRYARGPALLESSFYRLVEAMGDFAATGEYHDLAALIRHPEMDAYIGQHVEQVDWLVRMDQWYERHLPGRIRSVEGLPGMGLQKNEVVRKVIATVLQVMGPLLTQETRGMNQWPESWNQVLATLLAGKEVHQHDPYHRSWIRSLSKYTNVLQQFQELSDDWVVQVHCADFLRLVFAELKNQYIAPAASPDAIALLGWLDTPLDDAPVTVVTSFNEGLIPSSDPAHPFLNQSLRQQLQLVDNRRRYARDAYALELLTHSRKQYRIIVGRQNALGEPRNPSRLLMAMSVDELPHRARFLFQSPSSDSDRDSGTGDMKDEVTQLTVPRPEWLESSVEQIRVTDFKAYLACPYRYYLQRVLKLRSVDDQVEEMTGGQFGDVLHHVLEAFGKSEFKDSEDPEEIRLGLEAELEKQAALIFGKAIRASLRLQLTQAKLRLARFALAQVQHRRKGWRIEYLEQDARFWMPVDDEMVEIVGRIDRIDVNEKDGRWLVLDYKTSDNFSNLDRLYFKKKQWVDLQLPLYHHLVKSIPESKGKSISLGLIALPKKLDEIRFQIADWDDQKLRTAFDLAQQVAGNIRDQVFHPISDDRHFDPAIERICQTGVLRLEEAGS